MVELVPDGQDANLLRLTVKQTGRRCGIVCTNLGKLKLETGQWYDLSFNARTQHPKNVCTHGVTGKPEWENCLRANDATEVGGTNRMPYAVALHIRQQASKCRMVIALADTGTIWLDDLSVVLRNTAANH